ncbi:MAG: GNAT family N-acetyltransferase [Janthinobacterium lividum]
MIKNISLNNLVLTIREVKFYDVFAVMNYLKIRWDVYISEYKRNIFKEFDFLDFKAKHHIFIVAGKVVGVAKVLYKQDSAKISRVAVSKSYRGKGFGGKLIKELVAEIQNHREIKTINLVAAEKSLVSFYSKFGFEDNGQVYFDNIPYTSMIKHLEKI